MRKFNYRRGFLRLYMIASACWIVFVFAVGFSDRPPADPRRVVSTTPASGTNWFAANAPNQGAGPWTQYAPTAHGAIDYDALAKQAGAIDRFGGVAVDPWEVVSVTPAPPVATQHGKYSLADIQPPDQWVDGPNPARSTPRPAGIPSSWFDRNAWLVYWAQIAGYALIPPGFGYALLFLTLPWIGRGFAVAEGGAAK